MHTLSRDQIADICAFITGGGVPKWVGTSRSAQAHFRHKYDNKYQVIDSKLVLNGKIIAPEEDHEAIMKDLFDDPATRLLGRDRLYARVCERYENVPLRNVMDYLRRQELWQLHQPTPSVRKSIVRPIVPTGPHKHWQVDLINMTTKGEALAHHNHGFKYILTVIDVFSKFAFAIPCKSATEGEIVNHMRGLLDDIAAKDPAKVPQIIQSDNGGEFGKGIPTSEFGRLLALYNIKHLTSLSHTPQSQGVVERFNRTLKQMIYQHFTATGGKKWADPLPQFLANYNTTHHGTIQARPADVYDRAIPSAGVRDRLKKRAARVLARGGAPPGSAARVFKVGDRVRVALRKIDPKVRAGLLSGIGSKRFKVNYSHDIYTIASKSAPLTGVSNAYSDKQLAIKAPEYRLKTAAGERLPTVFYGGDLLAVPTNTHTLPPKSARVANEVADSVAPAQIPAPMLREKSTRIRKPVERLNL